MPYCRQRKILHFRGAYTGLIRPPARTPVLGPPPGREAVVLVTRQFSLQLSRELQLELQLRLNLVSTPARTQLWREQGIDFSNVKSAQARGVIPTGRGAVKPIATHDNVVESWHRRQQAGGECVQPEGRKAEFVVVRRLQSRPSAKRQRRRQAGAADDIFLAADIYQCAGFQAASIATSGRPLSFRLFDGTAAACQ